MKKASSSWDLIVLILIRSSIYQFSEYKLDQISWTQWWTILESVPKYVSVFWKQETISTSLFQVEAICFFERNSWRRIPMPSASPTWICMSICKSATAYNQGLTLPKKQPLLEAANKVGRRLPECSEQHVAYQLSLSQRLA